MNRILIILVIVSFSNSYGQQNKMSFERLKALKMSYITKKLDCQRRKKVFFGESMISMRKEFLMIVEKKLKK